MRLSRILWTLLMTGAIMTALVNSVPQAAWPESGDAMGEEQDAGKAEPQAQPPDAQPEAEAAAAESEEPYRHEVPPAASERADERKRMVEKQIAKPRYGSTPIKNETVLEAMRTVPRHAFVPKDRRGQAYDDTPLPIGHGQTISQPYIVGLMTELLELTPESKVLEIGTGSGYQAAVLAHLTPNVYTIEIIKPLAERAASVLTEQGYKEVHCRLY